MGATLYYLAEGIRCIAIMLQPFVPESCIKLLQQVGYSEEQAREGIPFEQLKPEFALKEGAVLPAPTAVFPRFEADSGAAQGKAHAGR